MAVGLGAEAPASLVREGSGFPLARRSQQSLAYVDVAKEGPLDAPDTILGMFARAQPQ